MGRPDRGTFKVPGEDDKVYIPTHVHSDNPSELCVSKQGQHTVHVHVCVTVLYGTDAPYMYIIYTYMCTCMKTM